MNNLGVKRYRWYLMQDTATPAHEMKTICGAMPLWVMSPSPGGASSVPGIQTQPFAPSVSIIRQLSTSNYKRRTNRAEGAPFAFSIEAAEIPPEQVTVLPFSPREQVLTVAPPSKSGRVCVPRTNGIEDLGFRPHPGLTDRRGHRRGSQPTPEPALTRQPSVEINAWVADVLRPSDLTSTPARTVVFEVQTGGSAEIRRPKQALRELVLPSPRPWNSLTIPWESFRGFHVALPSAESIRGTSLQTMQANTLWDTTGDLSLAGRRPLQIPKEIAWRHAPAADDVRTKLPRVQPAECTAPIAPGLKSACPGEKLEADIPEPFPKMVPEMLPLAQDADAPAPGLALSSGLPVWAGTINSYSQRAWCSPRWREGGRAIQMLRLAPTVPLKEERKISAA